MVVGQRAVASGRDNRGVLGVRDENRSENDGKPATVQHHERHSDIQLPAVLLQRSALFVGKLGGNTNIVTVYNISQQISTDLRPTLG